MLSTSAKLKINADGVTRDLTITPLFLQNHKETWQPNEIYEIVQTFDVPENSGVLQKAIEPIELGKIIVNDKMDWRYEGDHEISDDEVQQIAQFVLSQV